MTAVANDDAFTVTANRENTIVPPGVLANDSWGPGPVLGITNTPTGPSHGTLHLFWDGSFIYTPATGYVGTDSFGYTLVDENDSTFDTATVTLTVVALTGVHPVFEPTKHHRAVFESED